ncbi:MAG: DNA-binding CsgD family transcriptional regulator [Crocinitomix sp.]|jgi:DNA-binding CsgD family transcriptional regulator
MHREIKYTHHFFALLSFCSFFLLSCGHEQSVEVDYSFKVSKNVKHDVNQFQKVKFESFKDLNLGFYKGNFWIKLEISNDHKARSLMFVNYDLFNWNYKFYKLDTSHDSLKLVNEKERSKQDHRTFNNSYPNLRINLNPNEHATFIITAECDGRTINATPKLITTSSYNSFVNQNLIWGIVFIGTIIFLLILNMYLWNIHKNKIYLHYILYMFATLLMYFGFEGYLYKFELDSDVIDHAIFLFVRLWVFSLILFTSKFLGVREVSPRYYKFLLFLLVVVLGGNTIYQFVYIDSSIGHLHYYENVLSVFWLLLVLITILISAKSRKLELKFYLIPLSCFLLFIVLGLIDGHFRVLPGSPFVYIKIGTLIEFIGFTYFMTVLIKNKIDKADDLQIVLQQKSEELIAKSKKMEELNRLLEAKTSVEKTDLINIFTLLESSLNKENDWEFFKLKFNQLNPKFLNLLLTKHSELSKSEIRLLTLIRIGYSQKEIANILNIAADSVKKARSRVRRKLNLKASIKLSDYLNEF